MDNIARGKLRLSRKEGEHHEGGLIENAEASSDLRKTRE
jgi:hypothetical protein